MPAAAALFASERTLAAWLRVFVVVICAAIVVAVASFQYDARQVLIAKSKADAQMLANSLAQHASDTFEVADVLLATLAERLRTSPGRSLDDIYVLDSALEAQLRSVPRIRSLLAFDSKGRQFASSQPQIPDWFDLSSEEVFSFHEANFDDTIRIGAPTRSPSTNDWLVPVSRRWNDANGRFGGIVMATVRVNYFANFYKDFDVAGEAGISLLRGDGVMLSRYPLVEGRLGQSLVDDPASFAETIAHPMGVQIRQSPVDGVMRIYGYRRTEGIPMLMYVGISLSSILDGWLKSCIASMAGAVVFAAGLGFVGWRFAAEVEAGQRAESRWSELALTDSLTGVRNRRAFDEISQSEWRLAEAHRRPLSLVLIDVDHFKAFNDTYGHPAGDTCLRAIAEAVGRSAHRPGDVVARYGGEEFALLLSDTGPASALLIAERVRQGVLMLGLSHSASPTLPLVSISVGVATQDFAEGADIETLASLIGRADRALYRAKLEGRNRVEMEAEPHRRRAIAKAV